MNAARIFIKWGDRGAQMAQCALWLAPHRHLIFKEPAMAKGQKKSNKEIRKPKQAKAKPAPTTSANKK
ncbi:MAG TPA: hypothetical protein VG166_10140 [Caulobacteraceae bacterium]|jgi:hypothetical protein|nr:hypothetical protein [Caulobacteraceae bacterium]